MDSRQACSTLSSLAWNSPISSFILVKAFSMSVSHTVVCVAEDLVEASFFCFFTSLVGEEATMQDNTDAPTQAFYKCH